jgi:3-oxoacyl-[acyl-carrier protein] reductase
VLTPSRQALLDEDARARVLARIPSGRFVKPEEIATAVCFLAGPQPGPIAGHTVPGGGGLTAIYPAKASA